MSRSARNKGNKNGTHTVFELHYVTQFMDFGVLNLHLEVTELFSLRSGYRNLEIKIFRVSFAFFLSSSLSFPYFSSRSAGNKGKMNATGTGFVLQDVTKFMDFIVFESALGS